jgi:hypothetical protein
VQDWEIEHLLKARRWEHRRRLVVDPERHQRRAVRIRSPEDLGPAVVCDMREELLLVLDRLARREPERGEDVCARVGQQLYDRVPLPPDDDATLDEE